MMPYGLGKKKPATIVLGIGHEGPEEEVDGMEAHRDALRSVAEEIMHAIKNGSVDDLTDALKAFLVEHEAYGDMDEEEGE